MNDEADAQPRFGISFVAGVTLAKWSRVWSERHPELPLRVVVADQDAQLDALRAGEVEMAFVRLPIDRDGLSVIPLYREVPFVVLPKDHELSLLDEIPVEALAAEHLLQEPERVPEWAAIADEVRDATRRAVPAPADLDGLVELVAAGVGIAILPQSLSRLHVRKDVVSRPVTGMAETQIALVWPEDETGPDVEEFIGVVRGRSAQSSRGPQGDEPEESAKAAKKRQDAGKKGGQKGAQKPVRGGKPGRQPRAPRSSGKGGRNRGRGR